MKYVERLLVPGERVVFVTRTHWLVLVPTILIDLGITVVIVAIAVAGVIFLQLTLAPLVLLLLLAPLAHFLGRLAVWRGEQFIVTNRRVMEVRGILNKYVSDTSLEKVNDIVLQQSFLGRVLGYGDLRIIAGSEAGIDAFRRIARPIRFKAAILTQKGRLMPGEDIPKMLAQLEELRQSGAITQEEFEREKRELLERL